MGLVLELTDKIVEKLELFKGLSHQSLKKVGQCVLTGGI